MKITRQWILNTQEKLGIMIREAQQQRINKNPRLLMKMWLRLEEMKKFGRLKPDEDLRWYRLGERSPVFHVK